PVIDFFLSVPLDASADMVLVLVIGDIHIPHRAFSIPAKFRKLLVPNKMQHVLSTGNLCTREMLDYLRSLTGDVHVVKGDFDDDTAITKTASDSKVVTVGAFRIGLIHGHQIVPWGSDKALSTRAIQLDVDVLVSGHSHVCSSRVHKGILYLNPGSATGAFTPLLTESEIVPSFMLLDVQGDVMSVYIYRLVDDAVKVERVTHKKGEGLQSSIA
ncbi:vps-29, partial [Pristionchus pacificus]